MTMSAYFFGMHALTHRVAFAQRVEYPSMCHDTYTAPYFTHWRRRPTQTMERQGVIRQHRVRGRRTPSGREGPRVGEPGRHQVHFYP